MENRKIRVAITHGDTNGVGYELIFKTFAELEMLELCTPIIYGSPKIAAYHRKALDIEANFTIINSVEDAQDGKVNMLATFDDEVKVEMGVATQESSNAAFKALEKAMADYHAGLFDVLVTAPSASLPGFKNQMDYIENTFAKGDGTLSMIANDCLRMGFVTNELPLKDVAQTISKELVVNKANMLFESIRRDFNISNPRIAVMALNPETNGVGKEEDDIIAPAVQELMDNGVKAFGPYQAERLFGDGAYDAFDGVLAMYCDQGRAPFMAMFPKDGVTYKVGLPMVCTSACNDAGFDIAGKCVADETSFRHAVYMAVDIFRNRIRYDEPMGNPLKKLYRERRDESDKVRFAIPRKHENSIKEKQE